MLSGEPMEGFEQGVRQECAWTVTGRQAVGREATEEEEGEEWSCRGARYTRKGRGVHKVRMPVYSCFLASRMLRIRALLF